MFSDTINPWPEALLHGGVKQAVFSEERPKPISDASIENFPQHWLEGNWSEVLRIRRIALLMDEGDGCPPPDFWKVTFNPTCLEKRG